MNQTTILALAAIIYFAQSMSPRASGWMGYVFLILAVASWMVGK